MNANMYYGNQSGNPNMYYGGSYHNLEQGQGYSYNNVNNENNNPNYQSTNQHNYDNHAPNSYPQTGLTIADCEPQNSRTEFVLPESIKLGMILCTIFCVLCFFIVLLIK